MTSLKGDCFMTPPCQYLSLLCSFGKSKYSPNSKPRRPKYTVVPFIFARHHFNIQFCLATLIRCNYNNLLENKNIYIWKKKKNPKTNNGHLSYAIIIHLIVRFWFCILFGTNYFQSLQGNCDSPPSYNFYKRISLFFLAIITLFFFFCVHKVLGRAHLQPTRRSDTKCPQRRRKQKAYL